VEIETVPSADQEYQTINEHQNTHFETQKLKKNSGEGTLPLLSPTNEEHQITHFYTKKFLKKFW